MAGMSDWIRSFSMCDTLIARSPGTTVPPAAAAMVADPVREADPEWVVLTLTASLLRPGARREGATLIPPVPADTACKRPEEAVNGHACPASRCPRRLSSGAESGHIIGHVALDPCHHFPRQDGRRLFAQRVR